MPSNTSTNAPTGKSRVTTGGARAAIMVEDRTLSHGTPSTPLLGVLPLARWIPMDVHSMLDYTHGTGVASCALLTDDPRARMASLVLGGSDLVMSALTDYRLSAAKVIPLETHEAIDHLWGVAAIAAPFVLGYWKTAPRVALIHVIAGVGNILTSLVTDYRSYKNSTYASEPPDEHVPSDTSTRGPY